MKALLAGLLLTAMPSLYDFSARLTDQDGQTIGLDHARGQPVIVSMFYGTCPYACPMLINKIKRIENELPEELRGKVRVLLISFDPERDPPEKLKKLASLHGVDQGRWRFVRTDPETVEELAAVLGIKYRFLTDGAINHTTVISLVDRDGRIVEKVDGSDQDMSGFVEKLREVAR